VDGLVMLDFYKGKTVLITGHTGFKGSWLSEILIESGANVIGYALEPPTEPSLFGICDIEHSMTSVIGDIRDGDNIRAVLKRHKPEIVFHLAAQPIVLTSYEKPVYTYNVNVMGTVNVLEAMRKTSCVRSFVNITTDKVYENDNSLNHPFEENEKLDGFDPYSNSKSCSELVTHCYKKSFFKDGSTAISTARAGNVFGGGDFSPSRIIPDCIKAVIDGKTIEVRNKFSTRPYQFVLEPLFVYLLIAKKQYEDSKYSGYYNVGPDKNDAIRTGDLVDLFCKKWGEQAKWEDHSTKNAPHEADSLSLDNSLVKKTFGWKPIYHIDEALDKTIEWTKAFYEKGNKGALEIMKKQIRDFDKEFSK
jgi:CDP-glucose 4,6-dehydratase